MKKIIKMKMEIKKHKSFGEYLKENKLNEDGPTGAEGGGFSKYLSFLPTIGYQVYALAPQFPALTAAVAALPLYGVLGIGLGAGGLMAYFIVSWVKKLKNIKDMKKRLGPYLDKVGYDIVEFEQDVKTLVKDKEKHLKNLNKDYEKTLKTFNNSFAKRNQISYGLKDKIFQDNFLNAIKEKGLIKEYKSKLEHFAKEYDANMESVILHMLPEGRGKKMLDAQKQLKDLVEKEMVKEGLAMGYDFGLLTEEYLEKINK